MVKGTLQLIQQGEGLTVEFKRKIDSTYKIAKTIASFANTSGGVLFIGVDDNGEVLGIQSELSELQKLERAVTQLIENELVVGIKSERIGDKQILRVEIAESEDKPHYAKNEKDERIIYIRAKDKSLPIPRLLIPGEGDVDTEKLLSSRHVKTLINYLKGADSVTAKSFSKIINISEKRAVRMLNDLSDKQILLKMNKETFSLKWAD